MSIEAYLLEIEAREKEATPGPWDCRHYDIWTLISAGEEHICFVPVVKSAEKPANGQLMAHARTDIPTLLLLVRKYREALDEIRHRTVEAGHDSGDSGIFTLVRVTLEYNPRKELQKGRDGAG